MAREMFIAGKNPEELAVGYMQALYKRRSADIAPLSAVLKATSEVATLGEAQIALYGQYDQAVKAKNAQQSGILGDAIAYLSLQMRIVAAQKKGDSVIKVPDFDDHREEAIRYAGYAHWNNTLKNLTQIERAVNGTTYNLDKRQEVMRLLDSYYNGKDISIEEALVNIRNAKLDYKEKYGIGFFDDDRADMFDTVEDALEELRDIQRKEGVKNPQASASERAVAPAGAAAVEAPVEAAAEQAALSETFAYGVPLNISKENAPLIAKGVILSLDIGNGEHLDKALVENYLRPFPLGEVFGSSIQRQRFSATKALAHTPEEKKALAGVLAILALENRFAELREQGAESKTFADEAEGLAMYHSAGEFLGIDTAISAGTSPEASVAGAANVEEALPDGDLRWVPIEKQIQYDLEALGFNTGQPGGWNVDAGVDAMDGKEGQYTRAAKANFLRRNGLTEFNDEAMQRLQAQALAARAGTLPEVEKTAATEPGPEGEQPPATVQMNAIQAQFASLLAASKGISDAPKDYRIPFLASNDEAVRNGFLAKFVNAKGEPILTPEQRASFAVKDGIISGPLLGAAEKMLGMNVDGTMDERLEAALKDPSIQKELLAAFQNVTGGNNASMAQNNTPGSRTGNALGT
ncbi:MAG: hypothetical protein SFW64_02445 [Alphaproteobacteria bacterium]|nr:hypothetical protein [Alphaproteobacteria bacterium]